MSVLARPSSAGGWRWLRSLAVPRYELGRGAVVEAGLGRAEGRVCCCLKRGYRRENGALGPVFLHVVTLALFGLLRSCLCAGACPSPLLRLPGEKNFF